jgi:hypothetical protein
MTTSSAKLQHDLERINFLRDSGRITEEDRSRLLHEWATVPQSPPEAADSSSRGVHVVPPGRTEPGALADPARLAAAALSFEHTRPQACVVDRFLGPAALERLREYCLLADVWHDLHNGMLGAFHATLSTSPLMHQIVEELRSHAPRLFGPCRQVSFWAFKCAVADVGIGIHADTAAVTANLWITEDDANLDPGAGGMVVWDTSPPAEWKQADYNAQGEAHQEKLRRHLASERPLRLHVPYRANRCVLFRSGLLHASDAVRFRDAFPHRRINVTFLFS